MTESEPAAFPLSTLAASFAPAAAAAAAGGGRRACEELRRGGSLSDELGAVFAALADPTRRSMIEALLRDGTTSVPRLSADLPITRQAVAKHLAALDHAGLVERAPADGREVHYRLRGGALVGASEWIARTEAAWGGRLARLKDTVERAPRD